MTKGDLLSSVLSCWKLNPILVDIGSSGSQQSIFQQIAKYATIIGFDADSRGQDDSFAKGFKRKHLIPKAVVTDENQNQVEFVLTKYPSCSSTLEPDMNALDEMIFRDYFTPTQRVHAPAITLNKVLDQLNLSQFDWIKVDSQGTDMRLLKSIRKDSFDKTLAVDIEPGFIPCYKGEDFFVDTHSYLINEGFWLSDLNVQKYCHIRPETANKLKSLADNRSIEHHLKRSPTAAEARYFRVVKYFYGPQVDQNRVQLGILFALMDNQYGYAFDILQVFVERFGETQETKLISDYIVSDLKLNSPSAFNSRIRTTIPYRAIRKTVRHLHAWLQ